VGSFPRGRIFSCLFNTISFFCLSPQVSQGASSTSNKAPCLVSSAVLVRVCCAPLSVTDREDNKAGSSVDSWASLLVHCDQQFLRILNYNSYNRVILELPSYCNLLENTSLMPSQQNKLHNSHYEERKTEQNQTTLCLCANLPRACGLDAACASDSTSPKKI